MPNATGATWEPQNKNCWAEFGSKIKSHNLILLAQVPFLKNHLLLPCHCVESESFKLIFPALKFKCSLRLNTYKSIEAP